MPKTAPVYHPYRSLRSQLNAQAAREQRVHVVHHCGKSQAKMTLPQLKRKALFQAAAFPFAFIGTGLAGIVIGIFNAIMIVIMGVLATIAVALALITMAMFLIIPAGLIFVTMMGLGAPIP